MLTHSIEKYKHVPYTYTPPPHSNRNWPYPQNHPSHQPGDHYYNYNKMDKIAFGRYLGALPIEVGDWIVDRYAKAPYNIYQVHKVCGFEEIHHNIRNWGNSTTGPECMYVHSFCSAQHYNCIPNSGGIEKARLIAPGTYLVIKEEDIPAACKATYDAYVHNRTLSAASAIKQGE